MMQGLVRPYPDELLSSTLTRLGRRYRVSPFSFGKDVLRLPSWSLSFIGALPLPPICDLLRTEAETLLRHHTPLPYASAFTTLHAYQRCWEDAVSGAESPRLRALMGNAEGAPSLRKFCAACVRDDLIMHGESYWHLSHQLPGVLFCTRHGQALRCTTLAFGVRGPVQLSLPSECTGTRMRTGAPSLITVAMESVDLMHAREPVQRSPAVYRDLAQSRGYLETDRQVSEAAVCRLLVRRFSKAFLRTHGLLDSKGTPSWAAAMFRPNVPFGYAPIKHVLLETALTLGRATSNDCLSFRSSGPPPSDDSEVDAHYSSAAKQVLRQVLRDERVLTTEEFLRISGCYGVYKHRKDRMPKLRQMVLAFRSSAASVKPLGEGKTLFRNRPNEVVRCSRAASTCSPERMYEQRSVSS